MHLVKGNFQTSLDPDQTAPTVAVCNGSILFVKEDSKHFSRRKKQTVFVVIYPLTVNL